VAAVEGSVGGSAVEGSAVAAATAATAVAKAAAATVVARAEEAALRAAAEAAAACSEVAAAARCGRLRRWRRVMAVAVEEEDVRRSRRRSWRAPPPAPQQRATLRSGPTCAQTIRQSAHGPDARSNVGVGLRAGVHTLALSPLDGPGWSVAHLAGLRCEMGRTSGTSNAVDVRCDCEK
jgi:hypothetical protein